MYNNNIFIKKNNKLKFIKKKNFLFSWKNKKLFVFNKLKFNTPNLCFLNIGIRTKMKPFFFLFNKYFNRYKKGRIRKLKKIQY